MAQSNPNDIPGSFFRVDLRRLILWMCLFFVFLALANSLHAAYQVQRGLLLQHSLDANRSYAEKLSRVTDSFLEKSTQALAAAALDVGESRLDPAATQKELDQVSSVTDTFNAIIAVDSTGKIFVAEPAGEFPVGSYLQASQARALLDAEGQAAISGAFRGPGDRWLIIISQPIFTDGSYAGFVGGAVYLQGGSALQNALNKLHYQDRSYFYIVDETGAVVYHPDPELIGTSFKGSKPVSAVLRGEVGTERTIESGAKDQLVSYAPIPSPSWGVVAHRPTEVALSNIDELFLRTLYYSLPVVILSLLAIWWLSRFIARPLRELAEVAANLGDPANFSRIRSIKGWYLEAALIRKGLMRSFSAIGSRIRQLHIEGTTDPLTGALNRRGLDTAMERIMEEERNAAVVMVDVDHFKAVNDEYGHAVGDEVLKAITASIMAEARSEDVVARMGGEEFVILLPDSGVGPAQHFAERLRSAIERTAFDNAGSVTISLGVACYPEHGTDIHDALALADAALYRAKAAGRNRVHLA